MIDFSRKWAPERKSIVIRSECWAILSDKLVFGPASTKSAFPCPPANVPIFPGSQVASKAISTITLVVVAPSAAPRGPPGRSGTSYSSCKILLKDRFTLATLLATLNSPFPHLFSAAPIRLQPAQPGHWKNRIYYSSFQLDSNTTTTMWALQEAQWVACAQLKV